MPRDGDRPDGRHVTERPSLAGVPLLFERLAGARRVLVAGAGGGFDVYAALPIALALMREGRAVHLGNLTFSNLRRAERWIGPGVAAVSPDTSGSAAYFPERTLARWLAARGLPATVYAFQKVGVEPLRAAYRALVAELEVDAIVLVDGGTDILMTGDEAGLGTPMEDMASLAAVAGLPLADTFVACVGFGIDAYHGVCHAHFLENVAALERDGGYLGAFSMSRHTREGQAFLEAVAAAQAATPTQPSIVNGSIAAAVEGKFGDVQFTERTEGSELFINPLMGLYFTFELQAVAKRVHYLPSLEGTVDALEVMERIALSRPMDRVRPWRAIPH